MYLFIVGLATCFGCLAGLGAGVVIKTCPLDAGVATPVLLVGGVCAGLWLFSMLSPTVPPLYKLLGPVAASVVGASAFGLFGFVAGFALAGILQLVADFRRFALMERSITMGFNIPGITAVEEIIAREAVSLVVAAVSVGVLLKAGMGIEWLNAGSGRFAEMISGSSTTGSLVGLTLLGGVVGTVRQAIESLAAYMTARGVR